MSQLFAVPVFDVKRAVLRDQPMYPMLRVERTRPLGEALREGSLAPDARMLVMQMESHVLVFEALHLIYHHVASGVLDSFPWVASFCSVCNGGAVFDARIDGEVRHFEARGMYNAMILMGDVETGSYWDHITGKCIHGASVDKALKPVTTLLHQSAGQAAAAFPHAALVVAGLDPAAQTEAQEDAIWSAEVAPVWSKTMHNTLVVEDKRLPRLEMGLGIWSRSTRRYYPVTALHSYENMVFDRLDGRGLLIYIAPETGIPEAFFTDARTGRWYGDDLRLNTGETIRGGVLHGADGAWQPVERPLQLFYRWYSFALQFPDCTIFTP